MDCPPGFPARRRSRRNPRTALLSGEGINGGMRSVKARAPRKSVPVSPSIVGTSFQFQFQMHDCCGTVSCETCGEQMVSSKPRMCVLMSSSKVSLMVASGRWSLRERRIILLARRTTGGTPERRIADCTRNRGTTVLVRVGPRRRSCALFPHPRKACQRVALVTPSLFGVVLEPYH